MTLADSMWHLGHAMDHATPEQVEAFWPHLGCVLRVLCFPPERWVEGEKLGESCGNGGEN